MLVQESKKVFANVCLQRFFVWWVKPSSGLFILFPKFTVLSVYVVLPLQELHDTKYKTLVL